MPAMIECPNCDHPGPMGFNDPVPWGRHYYHSQLEGRTECRGAWQFDGEWYKNEAGAYLAWKKTTSNDPDWEKAFDAKILRGDMKAYKRLIKIWRDKCC